MKLRKIFVLGALALVSCGGHSTSSSTCSFSAVVSGTINDAFTNDGGKPTVCSSSGDPATLQTTSFALFDTVADAEVKMISLEYSGVSKESTPSSVAVTVSVTDGEGKNWASDGSSGCVMTLTENANDDPLLQSTYGTGTITCADHLQPTNKTLAGTLSLDSFSFTGLIPYGI